MFSLEIVEWEILGEYFRIFQNLHAYKEF